MSDIAIKLEGLGKKYVIGQQKSGDLRSSFGDKIKGMLGKNQTSVKEEFWALQDINFEIKKGVAVGIIGRNGAGKSTLLKILSRITEPTKGRFEINGRVSSLLEVGTGFHMELTGRENIYLNGTILGMKRREIKAKFDEIVAFSGVERFIDTPVKHYSSGMKVRLAFSVAAHLEPEILIIDEVLAVGDAEFQKKCLGKMEDVAGEGRTVLFVSHNMGAVQKLCQKGIFLLEGQNAFYGNIDEAVSLYLKDASNSSIGLKWVNDKRDLSKQLEILSAEVKFRGKQPDLKLLVNTELLSNTAHSKAFIAFNLQTEENEPIFQAIPSEKPFIAQSEKKQIVQAIIDMPPLISGNYKLSIWVGSHYTEMFDWSKEIILFNLESSPMSKRTYPHSKKNGFLEPKSELLLDEIVTKKII